MHRHTKQRLQKVFYLPLEYQIFFNSDNQSRALFPYSFKPYRNLKKPCQLSNDRSVFTSNKQNEFTIYEQSNESTSQTWKNFQTKGEFIELECNSILSKKHQNDKANVSRTTNNKDINVSDVLPESIKSNSCNIDKRCDEIQNCVDMMDNNSNLNRNEDVIFLCSMAKHEPSSSMSLNITQNNIQFNSFICNEGSPAQTSESFSGPDQQLLKTPSQPNEVKIMSYNILSQTLLERHAYLYQNSQKHLEWVVRFKKIINEILDYNCDIVCLQEVEVSDVKCFANNLIGYKYIYKKRTGPNDDGCCIFYKWSKYEIVKYKFVEYFRSDKHTLMNKHNIGIILHLRSQQHSIIIANTHLLYNPRRSDIRYEQCKYFLSQIQHIYNTSATRNTSIVITGDLNSLPNSRLVHFILNHKFHFECAYDLSKNFVSTYHDSWCLVDYIFYTNETLSLSNYKILPKCNQNHIERIPNQIQGSDHFSLVGKFNFS